MKQLLKRLKPQIINPHSYNTHTKHSQPLKLPFKMFELDRIRIMVYKFNWLQTKVTVIKIEEINHLTSGLLGLSQ